MTSHIVPHDALFQNCINGCAPLNKKATRAPDKASFETPPPPKPLTKIQNNFKELLLIVTFNQNCTKMVMLHWTIGLPELHIRTTFKWNFLLNHWSNFKNNFTGLFLMMPFFQNCRNGSSPLNKGTALALHTKCLQTTSPEQLVQSSYYFTWMVHSLLKLTKKSHSSAQEGRQSSR